jgi:hypothetical protein
MNKKFTWKVWLRPNVLTKDVENDYVAEVETVGKTMHNPDIAQAIKDEGSELQYETILDILNRGDRIRRNRVLQGYSVQTGIVHVAPRVPGNWHGATANPDPAVNKPACDMYPSPEMHEGLKDVGVAVLGVKDSGARIGLITDVTTGKTNGEITVDGDLIVDGYKIKVAPLNEAGIGIYFTDESGTDTPVLHPLTQNDPKRVIFRVPALAAGYYQLKIITRYTGGLKLLKEGRVIYSGQTLTVNA